ncbi:thioredoxin-like protein [Bombardia bombarda]|uniref:Thioredoxin-like protein n=1 Tax=Bombardia bombarda TaxID=252184 RepID=A0AA40BY18_9PEZI|nr:thioredoxin-like protein [Bombardia bombarda]
MRLLNFSLLFSAAGLAAAAASPATDSEGEAITETYFNQQRVPPMLELTPTNWATEVKGSKWMMVKHFSPYCPHCIDYAPTFQTLYEFYYTSKPGGAGNEDKNFTGFYDFKFASVNCVAYYDLCIDNGVQSYPTTSLYKDGELKESVRGVKNMTILTGMVEDALEKTKSGTRPANLQIPAPGAKEAPGGAKGAAPKELKKASEGKPAAAADEKKPAAAAAPAPAAAAPPAATPKADGPAPEKPTEAPKPKVAPVPVPKKAKKPSAPANPNGVSVNLNPETFQTLVTMTQDPWFIKFYAPWCHHCQAMAPNWDRLAKEMKGKLNIGEVNCDKEARLCKDARLQGYPTILFFKGGERVEFDGLRGLGDFVQYANKAIDISSGVDEADAASFKALEEKEDVIFIYFYDHATTSEDFLALERLSLSLIGHAKLVKTQDPVLYNRYKITTWPRLIVSREGRPTYYTPLTPKDMRDTRQVLKWMKSVWQPIVPEVTASNAREIMDGKIVVLGILNRDGQESYARAIKEMKSAANEWMDKQIQLFQLERQELRDAKQLRIEEAEDRGDQRALRAAKSIKISMDMSERKQISFAWVDGVFWQRWIRTTYGIDVKDGERVIINDEDNRQYWDQTSTGNPIVPSRTSILETINKVTASPPKIKPKFTISAIEKIFFDIRVTFTEHPYLTMGCVLGLAFGMASWFRGRYRRTRGSHSRLDHDSIGSMKDFAKGSSSGGLSLIGGGSGANGKKD